MTYLMYLFVAIVFKPHAQRDGEREREKEGGRERGREREIPGQQKPSQSVTCWRGSHVHLNVRRSS